MKIELTNNSGLLMILFAFMLILENIINIMDQTLIAGKIGLIFVLK